VENQQKRQHMNTILNIRIILFTGYVRYMLLNECISEGFEDRYIRHADKMAHTYISLFRSIRSQHQNLNFEISRFGAIDLL